MPGCIGIKAIQYINDYIFRPAMLGTVDLNTPQLHCQQSATRAVSVVFREISTPSNEVVLKSLNFSSKTIYMHAAEKLILILYLLYDVAAGIWVSLGPNTHTHTLLTYIPLSLA